MFVWEQVVNRLQTSEEHLKANIETKAIAKCGQQKDVEQSQGVKNQKTHR